MIRVFGNPQTTKSPIEYSISLQRFAFPFVELPMKSAILVYDGECRFCANCQKLLQRFVGWRLKTVSSRERDALDLHPELTIERVQARLYLVNGEQIFGGMEAIAQTLALRPVGKIALIYYAPLLRSVLDAIYGWIARHRYEIFGRVVGGCESGACSISNHQNNHRGAENAEKN